MKKIDVPIVGNYYHFWDDGKTGPSRHYICKVEKIITIKEAKGMLVSIPEWNEETQQNDFIRETLYNRWQYQVEERD